MSKTTGLLGALGAFGALAYLMTPLSPEAEQRAAAAIASGSPAPTSSSAPEAQSVPMVRSASVGAAPASSPDTAVRLVQQIQTELLRLGCYDGAVDGQWSAETQRAIQTLGERVRVLRPVDTPDYIMLALARRQASHVCIPHGRATASHQPARIVPMAGPLEPKNERTRTAAPARRHVEPAAGGIATGRTQVSTLADRRATADGDVADRSRPGPAEDEVMPPREREDFERTRMGLGAATINPLASAGEPRDAGAYEAPQQRLPIAVPPADRAPPRDLDLIEAPRRAPRSVAEARPAPRAPARSDWKRTVFNKLKLDGP